MARFNAAILAAIQALVAAKAQSELRTHADCVILVPSELDVLIVQQALQRGCVSFKMPDALLILFPMFEILKEAFK